MHDMMKGNPSKACGLVLALALIVTCRGAVDDCAGVGVDGIRLTVVDSLTGSDLASIATVTVTQLSAPFASA